MKDKFEQVLDGELQRVTQDFTETVKKYNVWRNFIEILPIHLFPPAEKPNIRFGSCFWPLYITFPLQSKLEVETFVERMKATTWTVRSNPVVGENFIQYYFSHPDFSWPFGIYITFAEDETATSDQCHFRKIGEQKREYTTPVYELVCPEGAAEDAFVQEADEENTND